MEDDVQFQTMRSSYIFFYLSLKKDSKDESQNGSMKAHAHLFFMPLLSALPDAVAP